MTERFVIGVGQALKNIDGFQQKQLPFALALGLTRTVQRIKGDIERTIPQRFDRPTPFTQRALSDQRFDVVKADISAIRTILERLSRERRQSIPE